MAANTDSLSAICGTQRGLTKLPVSMRLSPVPARPSTSAALLAASIARASFCRPSRGPTSTRETLLGICMVYQVAGGIVEAGDMPRERRANGVLHFHGLHHQQRCMGVYLVTG